MDDAGTTRALTTLSPILPERMRELRNRLRVVRYTPGLGRPLLQLGFIHYARWLIIDGLPPAHRGGRLGLRWNYLLFESNYDGSRGDYLRTFADVVPARIARIWGACFGFDANVERGASAEGRLLAPTGFVEYVNRNRLKVIAFYAAYPKATAIDVRQAIGLRDVIDRAADNPGGEDYALQRIEDAGPMALGPLPGPLTIRERVHGVYSPWKRAVLGRYGVNPLTVITPLAKGTEAILRERCNDESLLGGLAETQTHFARLVIVPPYLTDVGQPDPDFLETSYLLLTSDGWGQTYDQVETIRTHLAATADLLWGECDGYDGHANRARFHAWVNSHAFPTRYYVAGYPPRTVSEIKLYLNQRRQVASSYAEQPHPPASRLLADLEENRG